MKEWYLKQIKAGLPMLVTLDNGRTFIILSVSGTDDNLVCKTVHLYEEHKYAIDQQFNDFWDKITGLIPKYHE